MNNVNLIGYLGKDFEIGTTNSGRVYAKNSLAITKRWKNERGNEESSTTWIPIVLFGKSAESASTHIKKVLSLRVVENYHPINIKMKMEILEQC